METERAGSNSQVAGDSGQLSDAQRQQLLSVRALGLSDCGCTVTRRHTHDKVTLHQIKTQECKTIDIEIVGTPRMALPILVLPLVISEHEQRHT